MRKIIGIAIVAGGLAVGAGSASAAEFRAMRTDGDWTCIVEYQTAKWTGDFNPGGVVQAVRSNCPDVRGRMYVTVTK